MSEARDPARVWYQSFTDRDVDSPYFTRLGEYVAGVTAPGVVVDVHGLRPGDRHLHPLSEFRCAGQVIRNALAAEREGYDAFVIGHFQEPGLQEARASVGIPVLGLGEATMLYGCTLGRMVGLVTINPVFIPYHEDQIARVRAPRPGRRGAGCARPGRGLQPGLHGPRPVRADARGVLPGGRAAAGARVDVIDPAGGYPMLLFSRERGFEVRGETVLNGLPVVLESAAAAVRLQRLNGTGLSRRSTYALPPAAAVAEFEEATRGGHPRRLSGG